jgi:hypothetical protein
MVELTKIFRIHARQAKKHGHKGDGLCLRGKLEHGNLWLFTIFEQINHGYELKHILLMARTHHEQSMRYLKQKFEILELGLMDMIDDKHNNRLAPYWDYYVEKE